MLKWLLIGGGIGGAGVAGFLGYRKWSSSEQKRIDTLIAQLVQEQAEEGNKPEGWTPPVEPVTGMMEPDLRALAPIVPIETPRPRRERRAVNAGGRSGQVSRYRTRLAQEEIRQFCVGILPANPVPARIPQEVRESYERDFRRHLTEQEVEAIRDRRDRRRLELVAIRESIPEAMVTRLPPLPEKRVVEALHQKYPVQLCACDNPHCHHGQVRTQA